MGDNQLAADSVRDAVLLRGWIKFDLDSVLCVLLQSKGFNGAAERRLDFEAKSGLEWTSVLDGELLDLGLGDHILLPLILELKIGVVEQKRWCDKVGRDVGLDGNFGLALTADHYLALPGF